jgi:predicted nucleic acid-binding protein
MTFLPDTNACIALLRASEPRIIARWRATPVSQMALCSVVVYELRHGAERCRNPQLGRF